MEGGKYASRSRPFGKISSQVQFKKLAHKNSIFFESSAMIYN